MCTKGPSGGCTPCKKGRFVCELEIQGNIKDLGAKIPASLHGVGHTFSDFKSDSTEGMFTHSSVIYFASANIIKWLLEYSAAISLRKDDEGLIPQTIAASQSLTGQDSGMPIILESIPPETRPFPQPQVSGDATMSDAEDYYSEDYASDGSTYGSSNEEYSGCESDDSGRSQFSTSSYDHVNWHDTSGNQDHSGGESSGNAKRKAGVQGGPSGGSYHGGSNGKKGTGQGGPGDESNGRRKRPRNSSRAGDVCGDAEKPLACPYYKQSQDDHPRCAKGHDDLSRVKLVPGPPN